MKINRPDALFAAALAVTSGLAHARTRLYVIPTSAQPTAVSNLGTMVGGSTRWSLLNGTTVFGSNLVDISAYDEVVISSTLGRYRSSTGAWQVLRGITYDSCPGVPGGPCMTTSAATPVACSNNGDVVVGNTTTNSCFTNIVTWTTGPDPSSVMGAPPARFACEGYIGVYDISGDGSTLVGYHGDTHQQYQVNWTMINGSMVNSQFGWGDVAGATADGRYMAMRVASNVSNFNGIKDRLNTNTILLPTTHTILGMAENQPLAVGIVEQSGSTTAFIRLPGGQAQDLYQYLSNQQTEDITGYTFTRATAVSRDGRYIAGTLRNNATLQVFAFVVDLDAPCETDVQFVHIDDSLGQRWQHTIATDPASNSAIAFGGRNAQDNFLNETLRLDEAGWTLVPGAAPSPRADHAMTGTSSGIILYGGKTEQNILLGGTWRFLNNAWTQVTTTTRPSPRGGHAMAFDALSNKAVLFGGFVNITGPTTGYSGETWTFNGTQWTLASTTGPAARFAHAMASNPVTGDIILFGGHNNSGDLGDTWRWTGTQWVQIVGPGPSPRFYHSLQYDQVKNSILLIGGMSNGVVLDDQWDLTSSGWSQRTEPFADGPIWAHAAVTMPGGQMLVTGGSNNSYVVRPGTFESSALPIITEQPNDTTVIVGQTAELQVVATNGSGFSYAWLKEGNPLSDGGRISGANTDTLTISDVQASDAGQYSVIVTNCAGATESHSASLGVSTCDSIDFNNDSSIFDPQDVDAFLSVYSEGPCVPEMATCNDIDFNNDGSVFDPRDIDAFLSVFSEGPCF